MVDMYVNFMVLFVFWVLEKIGIWKDCRKDIFFLLGTERWLYIIVRKIKVLVIVLRIVERINGL